MAISQHSYTHSCHNNNITVLLLGDLSIGDGTLEESASGDSRSSMFVVFNPFVFNTPAGELKKKVSDYDRRYGTNGKTNHMHKSPFSPKRSVQSESRSVESTMPMPIDDDNDCEQMGARKSAHFSYDHYNL